jgi:hypothetical protein
MLPYTKIESRIVTKKVSQSMKTLDSNIPVRLVVALLDISGCIRQVHLYIP